LAAGLGSTAAAVLFLITTFFGTFLAIVVFTMFGVIFLVAASVGDAKKRAMMAGTSSNFFIGKLVNTLIPYHRALILSPLQSEK
jgi:hypothetical protein